MTQPTVIPTISARAAYDRLVSSPAESAQAGGGGARGSTAGSAALLVDVREPFEFAQTRAEGAALLPISTFMLRHAELPKDRAILVICQSGARSQQVTAFLLANGWPDVMNVVGGTLAWAAAGLPVRHGPPQPGEGDLPG